MAWHRLDDRETKWHRTNKKPEKGWKFIQSDLIYAIIEATAEPMKRTIAIYWHDFIALFLCTDQQNLKSEHNPTSCWQSHHTPSDDGEAEWRITNSRPEKGWKFIQRDMIHARYWACEEDDYYMLMWYGHNSPFLRAIAKAITLLYYTNQQTLTSEHSPTFYWQSQVPQQTQLNTWMNISAQRHDLRSCSKIYSNENSINPGKSQGFSFGGLPFFALYLLWWITIDNS